MMLKPVVKNNLIKNTNELKLLFVIFLVAGLSLFTVHLSAQTNVNTELLYKKAKSLYDDKNYLMAIESAKKVIALDNEHVNAHLILAFSYEEQDSPVSEIFHLKRALEITDVPHAYYWLGEAYYKQERYSEALFYYNQYKDYKYISEKRKILMACKIASCTFNLQALRDVNSNQELVSNTGKAYWPVSSQGGQTLIFTNLDRATSGSSGEDSFVVSEDLLKGPDSKPLHTNSNLVKSNSAFQNPEIVFFTACNRTDGIGDCDIYFSRLIDGSWSEAANAGPALNSEYMDLQPFYNPENKILYFSSNRPGGKGKKDIWRTRLVSIDENGIPNWEPLENVDEINSNGNEISPFFDSKEKHLYFASDTRAGLGGFDLYQSVVTGQGAIQTIVNLGYPINTNADELGLLVTYMHDTAFFSSARTSEEGLEIFAFNLTKGLQTDPIHYLQLRLVNKKTKQPVQAEIELIEVNRPPENNTFEQVNDTGEKILCLKAKMEYLLNVSANGYMFYSANLLEKETNSLENLKQLTIELTPLEIGAEMDLNNIYYETNSFDILPASEPELDRLVSFLFQNKEVKVEIQGHTDSTGEKERNLVLSKQRAKSVADYLVNKKIDISRIRHTGFGDEVPVASNETEEGRRRNRRTTIKITEL